MKDLNSEDDENEKKLDCFETLFGSQTIFQHSRKCMPMQHLVDLPLDQKNPSLQLFHKVIGLQVHKNPLVRE